MSPLDMVKLTGLMELTSGIPEIMVGLIDGPVAINHPDLASEHIRATFGKYSGACTHANSAACMHGTFVAGILCAKRGSDAPAICPNCTLLVHPIFAETASRNGEMPSASSRELAEAIIQIVDAGAHVINLSAALAQPSSSAERELEQALDYAARRGVIVVAAAGNQGTIGSSAITRHQWVISIVACDLQGRPISQSNMGNSIGRRGLSAPGEGVISLGTEENPHMLGGTSAAAPFVTGTIALLWSEFPTATAAHVKLAVTEANTRRATIVPPLLDASRAYQIIKTILRS